MGAYLFRTRSNHFKMSAPLRVAAVQLRAHDRCDFPKRLEHIVERIGQAASQADLVVLPEATFPGYVLGAEAIDETAIEAAVKRLCEIAAATLTVIVAGIAVAGSDGTRNGAIVVDADGSLAGRADKLFLWHFDRRWFVRGDRLEPIPTRLGVLGVLICADGRLPTIARTLVDRGAIMLVMPTAWVTSGRDPLALENVQADLLARVRAYENRVPFVAANKCGSELGMVAYCGKSQIVDESGNVVAIASEHQPELLQASVTPPRERARRTVLAQPAPRAMRLREAFRLAISFDPLPGDVDARLETLDDQFALSPDDGDRFAALDRVLPAALVGDEVVLDPAGLVPYRRAGYRLICWTAQLNDGWTRPIARARALELRLYIVVFDRAARHAFAVDPDGAIVAGTFEDYRLASFTLDPRKTEETVVAPGTDVAEGLAHVETLASTRC